MVTIAGTRDALRHGWWRARRQFGSAGLLGLALFVVATVLAAALPGLDRTVDQARERLQARRAALATRPAEVTPPPSEREQLDRFVGAFPPLSQNASDMSRLFESAARAHLSLAKGDYALRAESGSPFIAYTVTLPVRDGYPAIKAFAAEVLQALPHASLDEMRMARGDAGENALEASVRFTFVYRRL